MKWILFLLFLIVLLVFIILLNYIQIVRHERIEMQKDAVVGDMKYSARTRDYKGWLICDGRSLKREEYYELFRVIGTTYGSVSTLTFNLPDCRGRVLGASGQGTNLTNRPTGESIGEEKHTMLVSELVSHTHTGTTDISGNHLHTGTTDTSGDHTHTGTTNTTGDHTHSHNANGTNGYGLVFSDRLNTASNNLDQTDNEINLYQPPKALSISNNGSHNHTVSTTSNGAHTHTFTSNTTGQHTHTFTSNATGGGQAFNIIQPTLFIGNVFIYYGCKELDHDHHDHLDDHDH
jgi:microcystin-dependent protein